MSAVRRWSYPVVVLVGAALAGCSSPSPSSPLTPPSPVVTPAPASPSATTPPVSAPPSSAAALRFVFPVKGKSSYGTTHAGYPAADIFAACGSPVVAVTDGKVLEVSRADHYSKAGRQGPDNGGLSVSLLGDDGVRYYGSHLSALAAGIAAGVRVTAGQRLGSVGHTGNASGVCHLHFGVSPPCAGTADWWIRRGVVWPARFLDGWRAGRQTGAGSAVQAWRRAHGCPPAPA